MKIKDREPSGATPLEPDDLEGLIPDHITTREELNEAEFANISEAHIKYLGRIPSRKKAPITASWLKTLHREMYGAVWRWAGIPRKREMSVGVLPHHIEPELKKLEDDFTSWEKHKHDPLEISARLHHRLVWIHPFPNGNGRWARLAVNIYLKEQAKPLIVWPENEIIIETRVRDEYLKALRAGDKGDLDPLLKLHKRFAK